jgi:hypothetical protein
MTVGMRFLPSVALFVAAAAALLGQGFQRWFLN